MRTDFKVYDAMTKEPITVPKDMNLVECAVKMKEHDVGSCLVLEDGRITGIVTELDIVRKGVASNTDVRTLLVSNVMCNTVTTVEPDVDLFEAISTMAELNIRHLPVVHKGEFVGLLTAKDVLKIEPALFEIMVQSMEVREQENKPIFSEEYNEVKDYGHQDDAD